jgi:hypothetical protein
MLVGRNENNAGFFEGRLYLNKCFDHSAAPSFKSTYGVGGDSRLRSQFAHTPAERRPSHSNLQGRYHFRTESVLTGLSHTCTVYSYGVTLSPYTYFLSNMQLQTEVRRYQLARERIIQEFPGTDDETIRDTLEGITDLHEMIAAVIRSALVDEALGSGLRARVPSCRRGAGTANSSLALMPRRGRFRPRFARHITTSCTTRQRNESGGRSGR